jgi:hypothetical protein
MNEEHEFYCQKDEDGRCQECVRRILKPFKEFAHLYRQTMERMSKAFGDAEPACNSCSTENMDYAIAMLFREVLPGMPSELRLPVAKTLIGYATAKLELKVMPLSEKVLKDLTEADHV